MWAKVRDYIEKDKGGLKFCWVKTWKCESIRISSYKYFCLFYHKNLFFFKFFIYIFIFQNTHIEGKTFSSQLQSAMTSWLQLDTSSTNRDLQIRKNIKCEKAHNMLISNPIRDLFAALFKGKYRPSLERLFRERNYHLCD